MSLPIHTAPLIISDRTEKEMALTIPEMRHLFTKECRPTKDANGAPLCQSFIKIGLFFDGTNNNRIRDEPLQGHTNIVKLFKAHKDVREKGQLQARGHYRFYIPGLGTRFDENCEWRESQEGKAHGKHGQARILYALLEVYNAVYREFNNDDPKFYTEDITAKLKKYTQDIDIGDPLRDPHDRRPNRQNWFGDLTEKFDADLRAARVLRPKPEIPHISISVFGFSRGAALARAFCYWFNDILTKDGTFGGMPASIDFLGLFESVASVGLPQSVAETTPLIFADGHWAWAREILQPLPECVKETVHFIGAHEQRRNFPITRIKPGKGRVTEVLYPGVHADIGGGYLPGEQGRGFWNVQGEMAMLLSQIPLVRMHRAASVAGVSLVGYGAMPSDLKEDYAIDSQLALAWQNYMAAGKFMGESGTEISGDYHAMIRKHMALYYGYRRQYLHGLQHTIAFPRANAQEQEDLRSYNAMLRGDVALLEQRVAIAQLDISRTDVGFDGNRLRAIRFSSTDFPKANYWQRWLAQNSNAPKRDELWALAEMKKSQLPEKTAFLELLDFYVHDSLASFSFADYLTHEEKAEGLLKMATEYDATGKAPITPYKQQVWQNYQQAIKTDPALAKSVQIRINTVKQAKTAPGYLADVAKAKENANQQTVFTPQEQAALARLFPLQTDAHTKELTHVAVKTQSTTRREGSGYLRLRYVFE